MINPLICPLTLTLIKILSVSLVKFDFSFQYFYDILYAPIQTFNILKIFNERDHLFLGMSGILPTQNQGLYTVTYLIWIVGLKFSFLLKFSIQNAFKLRY